MGWEAIFMIAGPFTEKNCSLVARFMPVGTALLFPPYASAEQTIEYRLREGAGVGSGFKIV